MENQQNSILVSICCNTYNHENYIEQCLEGFVMQKTTFPFEILVHEDASTDNTASTVKEYERKYPELFRSVYQTENQFQKQNTLINILFKMARGKYIALCEGDDYWTDPYKLQKQVDFLEKNEEFVLCSHRYNLYLQNSGELINDKLAKLFIEEETGISIDLDFYFKQWTIQPLTVIFRKDAIDISIFKENKYFFDFILFYFLLKKGNGYLMPFIGGVYRRHDNGISTSLNGLQHSEFQYEAFKDLFYKEKTELLKEVYLYNVICYTNSYIRYSSKISYAKISNLLKEIVELTPSFKRKMNIASIISKSIATRIFKKSKMYSHGSNDKRVRYS